MRKLIIILFLLTYLAGLAHVNIYVATNGNDDTGNGTIGNPYLTIQKGADMATPGDTVIVRDGTYSPSGSIFLSLNTTGTSGNYLTLKSENKWGAVIDGLWNGTTGGSYGIDIGGSVSYVKIQDFEIKNFYITGMNMNNPATPNTYISIEGNHIHHINTPIDAVQNNYGIGIYGDGLQHITIDRNVINDLSHAFEGQNPALDHGLYFKNSSNILVTRNIFYNIKYGWSILCGAGAPSNWEIYNNTFAYGNETYNGQIILGNITNMKIKNNIFYGNNTAAVRTYYATITDLVLTNNIVQNGEILSIETETIWINQPVTSNNQEGADPLLVNPASYDFRLQSTSPAINAGIDVGLTTDYAGNNIKGLPDIGAYEFAGILIRRNGKLVDRNGKLIRQ